MGSFCPCREANPEDEADRNAQRKLNNLRQKEEESRKLLLLGAGNSGKSTFLKQILIIQGLDPTAASPADSKKDIIECLLLQMRLIIQQCYKFGFELPPDIAARANTMEKVAGADFVSLIDVADHIKVLWANEYIKESFYKRVNEGIADSAPYFFDSIDRIAQTNYQPTTDDVLYMRAPTTGVIPVDLLIQQQKLRIYDVGGQRSERHKWIHCFDMVTSVIFVASLSCYDQYLFEQSDVNAMHESINLFDEVINSKWFRVASMILFLNKIDIFKDKMARRSLQVCFAEYSGDNSPQDGAIYIENQFLAKNKPKKNCLLSFYLCN